MSDRYDVVVIGGAMVGATAALALAETGRRVAVVERSEPPRFEADADWALRVSAISRASQRVLTRLGVWAGVEARRLTAYRRMCVWDAGGAGEIGFDAADLDEPDLGHIVENAVIQDALLEALREHAGVDWRCPGELAGVEIGGDGACVRLADGSELACALVVGADGAQSRLRAQLGIDWLERDYAQKAVVATLQPEQGHASTAWQRFLPSGPLALLPLADGACSLVWSTDSEAADALVALDEAEFEDAVTEASAARLGRLGLRSVRRAFPLRGAQAREYVRHRVALVGDAAHVIHPLAGQGANLGFMDAAALSAAVGDAAGDVGGLRGLRRYARMRRADNLLMQRAMEGFSGLFGSPLAPVRWARNLGLGLTDRAPPLKRLFMEQALGLSGDLPPLARAR
jgi:2-octaprenylphenol hydroxylase